MVDYSFPITSFKSTFGNHTRTVSESTISHPSFSILIISKFTTSKIFIALSSPTEQSKAPSELTAMLSTTPDGILKNKQKHSSFRE